MKQQFASRNNKRHFHLPRNRAFLAGAWQNQSPTEASAPDEIDRLQARQRALEWQWTRGPR